MLADFIHLLRDNFSIRISAKTGWGKNELMMMFERAVIDTMTQTMDTLDSTPPILTSFSDPQGRLPLATDCTGETCREQETCNEN